MSHEAATTVGKYHFLPLRESSLFNLLKYVPTDKDPIPAISQSTMSYHLLHTSCRNHLLLVEEKRGRSNDSLLSMTEKGDNVLIILKYLS